MKENNCSTKNNYDPDGPCDIQSRLEFLLSFQRINDREFDTVGSHCRHNIFLVSPVSIDISIYFAFVRLQFYQVCVPWHTFWVSNSHSKSRKVVVSFTVGIFVDGHSFYRHLNCFLIGCPASSIVVKFDN